MIKPLLVDSLRSHFHSMYMYNICASELPLAYLKLVRVGDDSWDNFMYKTYIITTRHGEMLAVLSENDKQMGLRLRLHIHVTHTH